ncbi:MULTISPECIES: response regulator [Thermodesulfovibrio]|jgi:two-component system response regulator BaeR|uniref:DNA-binding response regulator n=2 Tax=Thermodesulfovibrio yellowstonii TaxID=28262 RepID=B5YG05_THEYD|nr:MULTISPECIES: response regulator [Thermodesulfovibrio]ACI22176.1 DNA-binding response regulator [Thermodesulfovibrio yellowstonii DSM 11347]GLI53206.1 DNA-binding response regulator [Thermodesulfovibrio islandicus]
MKKKILVVEDEPKLANLLIDYLKASGFEAFWLDDGARVIQWTKENCPDLIILDVMLPNKDGFEICREIRSFSTIPIIMVTARIEEVDRIVGLELGADDYICKPFSPRELIARVKAIFRRMNFKDDKAISFPSGFYLDENSLKAFLNGQELHLTTVEFRLLKILISNPGRVFTRSQLMDIMYPDNRIVSDRTIDSHIKKLRKKIKEISPEKEVIYSVYGAGYKFELFQ